MIRKILKAPVAILGAGVSGKAVAQFCEEQGVAGTILMRRERLLILRLHRNLRPLFSAQRSRQIILGLKSRAPRVANV